MWRMGRIKNHSASRIIPGRQIEAPPIINELPGPSTSSVPNPNAESNFRGKGTHPLLMELVLKTVFDFFDDVELRQVRGVCRFWKATAEEEGQRCGKLIVQGGGNVSEILENLKKSSKKITKLEMRDCYLDSTEIQTLVKKLLPTLSFLKLQNCEVYSIHNFCKFMRKVLPGLRKLDLGFVFFIDRCFGRQRNIQYFPIRDEYDMMDCSFENLKSLETMCLSHEVYDAVYLSNILETFPNLRSLVIWNMVSEDPNNFKNIRMPFLKRLTIKMLPQKEIPPCSDCAIGGGCHNYDGGLKDNHLNMLLKLDLKLEELDLTNINRGMDKSLFKRFLQSQQSSLKELSLQQFDQQRKKCTIEAPSPFPVALPKLDFLSIDRVFVKNLNHIFASCVNLRKLDLDFYEGADWEPILPVKFQPQKHLINLSVSGIQPAILRKTTPVWENVCALHLMDCVDEMLPVVYEGAKNLQTLSVYESVRGSLTATAFTGLPEEEIIMLQLVAGVTRLQINEESLECMRSGRKFIGSLTKLRFLNLHIFETKIIENIAKFAFKYCKDLNGVNVFAESEEAGLGPSDGFVLNDLKRFMKEDAGFIHIPTTFGQFLRPEFIHSYNGGNFGMDQVLKVMNLSVADEGSGSNSN